RNSNSGVAKLMRGSCLLPLKAARARRSTSSKLDTSNITVFMSASPFRDVAPEIREQPIDRCESIRLLPRADVAVVALARFVVVAQHAHVIDDEGPADI